MDEHRISFEQYLHTSFRPDCDYLDDRAVERNVGLMRHAYALGETAVWLHQCPAGSGFHSLISVRVQVGPRRIRVPDIVLATPTVPRENMVTSPPYLCVELVSPEDTMTAMQDRIDDYLSFGVPNIWVIDPWKHRGWRVTPQGWARAADGIMRTADDRVAMPLADVLLP